MNAKQLCKLRYKQRRKEKLAEIAATRSLEKKIVSNLMQCSEKTVKALSLTSFRDTKLETIKLPRRKQFSNATAWGKQKIRSGEKPLVWG